MADLLGPSGKQIPDHSLELKDLPLASAPDVLIVSDVNNEFVEKTGDAFIESKVSEGAEPNRVWSAAHLTAVVGDLEAALAGILAPIPIPNWEELTSGIDGTIAAIVGYNNELYVAGAFTSAGGVAAANIAKWDGSSWSALGSGLTGASAQVRTLIVFNGELCVGGTFTSAGGVSVVHTAKWNGTSWSALGAGVNSAVMAFAIHNSELYVCGNFTLVNVTTSPISANRVARWTGSAWAALGSGIGNTACNAMASFGGSLYVGGDAFTTAGGVAVKGIARWNGSWSAVPYGPYYAGVKALAVYNNKLYMGGISLDLAAAEGNTNFIGMWDGSAWHQLGGIGMNDAVYALLSFNGFLFVGGAFTTVNGEVMNRIAVWDGVGWRTIGSGMDAAVTALGSNGDQLYAGGNFTLADDIVAQHIALRRG